MKYTKDDIIVLEGEDLRRYQEEVLKIAKDVVKVLDEEGIAYSLSGGSVLGAVRHKGFIPWDDDIDLNMPRKDYDRMCAIFDEKLGDRYYLQTPDKYPELGLMVTQIRKKGTVARRKYDWNVEECGISIDLYIMENTFDNPFLRALQAGMSMGLSYAVSAIRAVHNSDLPQELQELEAREINYARSKQALGRLLGRIPLKKWIAWTQYWNALCKDEHSSLVAIPTGRKHFVGELYRRSDMCEFKDAPFEDTTFKIPVRARGFLSKFYGNYMEVPPPEKRERHVFLELKYK